MTTVEQCLEFFVTHNGEELKKQDMWEFKFSKIFGDKYSNEEIVQYLKEPKAEFLKTKDGVKFYTIHSFGKDTICLSKYKVSSVDQ